MKKQESVTTLGGKVMHYYEVNDESNQDGESFPIGQHITFVTDDRLTIKSFSTMITLFTKDETPFQFYQRLFRLEKFPVSIDLYLL